MARKPLRPRYPDKPDYAEPERSAVTALLDHVRGESADIASFTRELLLQLNDPAPEENVLLLRQQDTEPEVWVRTIIRILAGGKTPALQSAQGSSDQAGAGPLQSLDFQGSLSGNRVEEDPRVLRRGRQLHLHQPEGPGAPRNCGGRRGTGGAAE